MNGGWLEGRILLLSFPEFESSLVQKFKLLWKFGLLWEFCKILNIHKFVCPQSLLGD